MNPISRLKEDWFKRRQALVDSPRVAVNGHSNGTAEFAGAMGGIGSGVAPIAFVAGQASGYNSAAIGAASGYAGSVLDTVAMPPDTEAVSANGAWAGVGAMNMQVLVNDINMRGERMLPTIIEAMMDDPMVRACVDTRVTKMLCGELRFHPSVEEEAIEEGANTVARYKGDPEISRWAADFCERAHRNMDLPIPVWAFGFARDYLTYGHKVAEKILELQVEGPDAGFYYLRSLKIKAQWAYHLCTDPYLNMVAIYAQTIWGPAYIDKRHFFVMSNQPQDSDPRGTSILRGAKAPWARKQKRLQSQLKGDIQFGNPSVVLILPPGAPIESQIKNADGTPMTTVAAAEMTLRAFQGGGSVVIPAGAVLDVIESRRDGTQLVQSINYDDREIARGILNTNGAGILEPEHYTQGSGEHAQSKERGLGDYDRDQFLANVTKQIFHYLLAENFGTEFADLYTPKITLGAMPMDEFLKLATPISVMGQAGLLTPSELGWALKQAGFPPPKQGELRIGPRGPIADKPVDLSTNPPSEPKGAAA